MTTEAESTIPPYEADAIRNRLNAALSELDNIELKAGALAMGFRSESPRKLADIEAKIDSVAFALNQLLPLLHREHFHLDRAVDKAFREIALKDAAAT
ncbi:hypothetical protein BRAS3843_1130005 [Bradyrhizobium sp. STM 3843]|uniref:hypothetical protein n=1 Tax=Bradyrhizobium sp. STM 3843 TaxID=551947 RepID=UPI00024066AA|nr:hypothetical protein [Bradyrhizobium sp. STM 3843]CCE04774.1 hypothetical protein BRAS3843_1130005 [Bradyrhizobium sp. STM 3843]